MKNNFYFLKFFLVLMMLVVSAYAKNTIKIGAIVANTGPASFLGDPELKTLKLYVDKFNASQSLLGKKIELIHYDSQASPKKAVTFVKRLINQDKVVAIIGGSASGATLAISPFAQKAKIPLISLAGSVKIISPVKKYVFKTPATDTMACLKIFEYLKNKNKTKIALISGNGGFGKSMRGNCKKVASKYGIKILADETYGKKDTDMTSQLTKIKNTKGVQAVVNPGFGQGPVIVTKNFKQLRMTQLLVQSHGVASDKFIKLVGKAGENVLVVSPTIIIADLLGNSNPIKKISLKYIKEYESHYNESISTFGGYAFDALNLTIEAIKIANSTNGPKIQEALENIRYVGVNGYFQMSKKDHLGIDIDSGLTMLRIKNGDWKLAK